MEAVFAVADGADGEDDTHGGVGSYRLERIYKTPEILDEKAVPMPKGFSPGEHVGSMFRMFNSARQTVTLACDNDLMDAMIDRFGTSVKVVENRETEFLIEVEIAVNHVFYSWVFGFGGKVRIEGPVGVKEDYQRMVKAACEKLAVRDGREGSYEG